MAKRMVCVASGFAAAAIVYNTENILSRRKTSKNQSCRQCDDKALKIQMAIKQTREQITHFKNEVGAPGIVVGVSVDGKVLFKEDLENQVPAHEDTVMRIASISKSLTAALVGRLWQEGVIDIDQPIQKYVPSFPEKTFGDKEVTITTKQLMCHLSGIRHYSKVNKDNTVGAGDGQLQEFYGMERYDTTEKALSIFKNDELLHPPGSKYLYSTYGWTVVSAVMEGATSKTYPQLMRAFLREMGMRRTYLDEPDPIIYRRSKYYGKNKNGRIMNSPYVDNSCKWAGGGILSTVGDLLKFANAMLYAYQFGSSIDISKDKQVVGSEKKGTHMNFKFFQKKDNDKSIGEGKREIDTQLKGNKVDLDQERSNLVDRNAASVKKSISSATEDEVFSTSEEEGAKKGRQNDSDSSSPSNFDRMVEVGKDAGTAVKIVAQGVAHVGSYVWERVRSTPEKGGGKSDDTSSSPGVQSESSPSNLDRIKEVGSHAGTAVTNVGQGVANVGSYVWGSLWPTSEKEGEKDDGGSGSQDVQIKGSPSNLDRIKEVGSHAGTAVTNVGQGVANVGSYVWGSLWPTSEKEGEKDDGGSGSQDVQIKGSPSNLDRIKEVGSHAGTAVTDAGQGVANVGSYVWGSLWPTSEKEGEKKTNSVDRIKEVGSQAGTAAKYIGQGVANTGTYVWDKVWPTSGNQTKEKDRTVEKQSSSGDEENRDKEATNEQENKSWVTNFKNIFRPKALDSLNSQDFHHKIHSKEIKSLDDIYPSHEIDDQGILLKKIIPLAVNIVLGISHQEICDGKIIDEHSEYLEPTIGQQYHACNCHLHAAEKTVPKSLNKPYISQKTIASLWTRVENTKFSEWGPYVEGGYGLGFGVAPAVDCPGGVDGGGQSFMVGHTGGAVGASSALIIMPRDCGDNDPPKGVAVVILTNLQSVSLNPVAIEIARLFADATQ